MHTTVQIKRSSQHSTIRRSVSSLDVISVVLCVCMFFVFFFFFFSSRRRHTRCPSDWSSDVCSSDLLSFAVRGRTLCGRASQGVPIQRAVHRDVAQSRGHPDRKSTRLNSSHLGISY